MKIPERFNLGVAASMPRSRGAGSDYCGNDDSSASAKCAVRARTLGPRRLAANPPLSRYAVALEPQDLADVRRRSA